MRYSTAGLAKAGMEVAAPFNIGIRPDPLGEFAQFETLDLTFTRCARILPGRRLSGAAKLNERHVFAKVFYGSGARRYWQRELRGVAVLQNAAMSTPALLGHGITEDNMGYVIIYRLLEGAKPVGPNHYAAFADVVCQVAALHNANLVQTDMHLGNFLRYQGQCYVVDADGIRRVRLLRQQFNNLAVLLAQRSPALDGEVAEHWQRYAQVRGSDVAGMSDARGIYALVCRQRRERVRRYLTKTQRNCSEFAQDTSWHYHWLCQRPLNARLQRMKHFPEEIMALGIPLKLGNSATVVRVELEGERYIIKRYNLKNWLHRIRRWFKRRARLAWCNGHWLAFLGIPTARPVALLEQRWGWFVGACYLIMEDRGEQSLGQLLADEAVTEQRFNQLAQQVLNILSILQAAGIQHGDLKATNFVGQHDQLALIDYDAVKYGDVSVDHERFLANWQNQPKMLARWQAKLDGVLVTKSLNSD